MIKGRISALESQLENSKKSASELSDLIRKVSSDLKSEDSLKQIAGADNQKLNEKSSSTSQAVTNNKPIAVLVFACNRPEAIEDHLRQLIQKREAYGNIEKFPILVSQDCGDPVTAKSIEKFSDSLFAILKVRFGAI